MPRPNKGRTIGAEDAMRRNIARLLVEQDRTVAWVERRAGLPTQALWRSLNQGRTIYVNDAVAIADALGVGLKELLR